MPTSRKKNTIRPSLTQRIRGSSEVSDPIPRCTVAWWAYS
jgi:hypothetical protein